MNSRLMYKEKDEEMGYLAATGYQNPKLMGRDMICLNSILSAPFHRAQVVLNEYLDQPQSP